MKVWGQTCLLTLEIADHFKRNPITIGEAIIKVEDLLRLSMLMWLVWLIIEGVKVALHPRLQHLSECLFAFAFDEGEDLIFWLEHGLPSGDNNLFSPDHGDEDRPLGE